MLSVEELREHLAYNPETGVLTWKTTNRARKSGSIAGYKSDRGYIRIKFKGRDLLAHRVAWVLITGRQIQKNMLLDHINGVTSDNRKSNLRLVDAKGNARNRKLSCLNSTGISGVRPHRVNGCSYYRVNIGGLNAGNYKDFFEACCARKSAEVKLNYHENHGRKAV